MTESFHIDNDTCHNASEHDRQGNEGFADIHCHCLPGLDDGPVTQAQALELCRQMAEDGITAAIATPHQLGRYEGDNLAVQVRQAVDELNELLKQNNIDITILPGGEVRVDERICSLLENDKILTLADGGSYILLEIPHDIFINIESLIHELSEMGIQSVIAHAERIQHLSLRSEILNRWLNHGCLLQITASSLTGDFGLEFQRNAWQLLCSNMVSLIATDSHDTNSRSPQMRAAFRFISENLGPEKARLLCIENPSRIISNRDIVPVSVLNSQEADR
jgi:protein-tyrosine phosphatase